MTETPHETKSEPRHEKVNRHARQNVSFLKGFFAGALVGTAAGILFSPQAYAALRNLRRQLADTAANAGNAAAERYRQASTQVSDAVEDLHEKGRGAYGTVLSTVARVAQDVKDHATDAKAELDRNVSKPSARHTSQTS